jgi:hypothetical protein
LFERKVTILHISSDFRIGQAPQSTVLLTHDRTEVLEAGTAGRGIMHEQEITAPKALTRDCPVRLRVDREKNAWLVVRRA